MGRPRRAPHLILMAITATIVRAAQAPLRQIFLMPEGEATFTVGAATLEARGGQIAIVPTGVPRKFVNCGSGPFRQVDIHSSGRIG